MSPWADTRSRIASRAAATERTSGPWRLRASSQAFIRSSSGRTPSGSDWSPLLQGGEFRGQVAELRRGGRQPFGERLARRVDRLELSRFADERGNTREDPVLAGNPGAERRGEGRDLLRTAHPLEIALQGRHRVLGKVELVELRQLLLHECQLVRRKPRLRGKALALRLEAAPLPVAADVVLEGPSCAPVEVQELELARILEEAPGLARPVEVDPELADPLEGGERRQAAVHRDPRRLLARHAPLEDEQPLLAGRQVQLGEKGVHPARIPEEEGGLHLARRRALPDHGLVRPLASEEAERPDDDALSRAGFPGDRGEPGVEVDRHGLEEGQVSDSERLQHGGCGRLRRAA